MYKITIKTTYNKIELKKENLNTPEMHDVFEQPYIEEIHIENLNSKKKVLKKEEKKNDG